MKSIDFCKDWKFRKIGDASFTYVELPHDAMMNEGRSPDSPGESAHGWFLGGMYEYEKSFFIPHDWKNKVVSFEFGGVYKNSTVYINGENSGGCAYGYSEFAISADAFLKYGEDNIIRVVVDNSKLPNSRWYTGSGIYRPVSLLAGEQKHIERHGVKITTLSISPTEISVETKHSGGEVEIEIIDSGNIIARGKGDNANITIPNGRLWSAEEPNLYECRVSLYDKGTFVDQVTEHFGIRQLSWSNKGFFINSQETLLRGGCVHSDNGILGACSYKKSEERRVKMIKNAGYNAIRVSHNPASVFMLDACDKYGLYVIDETWDMWYSAKSKYDYAKDFNENYMFDIESLVMRDYNHPSVIMYSIGNEISEPATQKGIELTHKLADTFRKLDPSRAVTAGINLMIIDKSAKGDAIYAEGGGLNNKEKASTAMDSTTFNRMTQMIGKGMNNAANAPDVDELTKPSIAALDIAGYNYASGRYPLEGEANPSRVIVGSETFTQDIAKNWAMVKALPYLIGDFMWTCWGYLGEAGIGAWAYTDDGTIFNKPYPWVLADTGAMDILGDSTGEVFLAQAVWGVSKIPQIAVQPVNKDTEPAKSVWRGTNSLPGWSWRGCEGKEAIVEVFSDAYIVELLLNGKIIGEKHPEDFVARFTTTYTAGNLCAIAYDKNKIEISRCELNSAEGNFQIEVKPEDNIVEPGEIIYVPISIVGKNGVVERNFDTKLNVTVDGGELLAFGSANPRTEENYLSGSFTTYYGRAQAVVRAGREDIVSIKVAGLGLANEEAKLIIARNATQREDA